ncbi:hypothetical protein TDB9533_04662 [Thalassocella blandensis]|nr:hypothetical protein TDB9533_04662 [Thalassocella blandensis]
MKSFSWRIAVYSIIVLFGLLCAMPNLLPNTISTKLPAWYSNNTVALGLDLRGGSHLLLEVDSQDLLKSKNEQLAEHLRTVLHEARTAYQSVEVSQDAIEFTPLSRLSQNSTNVDRLEHIIRESVNDSPESNAYSIKQRDGKLLIISNHNFTKQLTNDAVDRSLEVVRRRLDESGLVEPSITRQGEDGILVQLPGVDNPQQIRHLLGTTAKMSFHWVSQANVNTVSYYDAQGRSYPLEKRIALEGKHISDARLGFHPDSREPIVNFHLDKEGAKLFGEMTKKNIGRALAIVLDDEVITAPVIRSVIAGGSGEISGSFTSQEASNLALLLRAGALPAPLKVIEERTVGPDLGSDSIASGISTGLIGAALVIAFMISAYGRWGIIACVGLGINVGLIFGALSLLGATLTLPGIAGIILTIGMAVDANILINERIREEGKKGRSALIAIKDGFKRAFSTIVDSNFTTLIAVGLLFLFGSGPVKGFAVTIGLGLATSLFTAIAITRPLMEWRAHKSGRKPVKISGIKFLEQISSTPINFMRGRIAGLVLSAVLSAGSIALFIHPGLKYGIDFSGGTVVEVHSPSSSVTDLRTALAGKGLTDAAIQEFGAEEHFLVRLPMGDAEQGASTVATGEPVQALKQAVLEISPDAEFPRVEMVGPKVSGGFSDATILALLLAGAGMLGYLWLRFEFHFALAAILTISLDLTKTIGFFVLTGVEFNLTAVAALLALIGYSINDKVVVFDRVRENLRTNPSTPLLALLNESITSTLTRTVFTSLTTFLALLPMAISGGTAVASFALPMLFGIVIGTSSSIFIAAPIVFWLGQRRTNKGLPQLRPTEEETRQALQEIP